MNKKRLSILFILVSMAMMAITDGMKGILMPVFMKQFQVVSTQMSLMLMLSSVGYILSSFAGGFLCEKFGHRRIFAIGLFLQLGAVLFFTQIFSYPTLLLATFLLSTANGLIGISLNTIIPLIAVASQAVFVNVSHFCYGVGLTGIQKLGGYLIFKDMDFHKIYMGIAVLCVFYILFFFLSPTPHVIVHKNSKKIGHRFDIIFPLMVLVLGFYAFCEGLMSSWFVNYMVNGFGMDFNQSSTFAAIFLLTFSMGRLLGGFLVERFGIPKSMCTALFLSFIFATTGIFLREKGFIFLSLAGMFFSICYPTCTLWIAKLYPKTSISMTGLITTSVSIHNMAFIFFLGRINDLLGTDKGFWLLSLSLFLAFVSSVILTLKSRNMAKFVS